VGKRRAVLEAVTIAEQLTAGVLDPAELGRQAAAECRNLFGTVAGPGDPLWPLHVEVARAVLAVGGGIGADELAEWVSVYRQAEAEAALAAERVSAGVEVQPPYSLLGVVDQDDGDGVEVEVEVEVSTGSTFPNGKVAAAAVR
jgi:hypothetical protein